MRYKIFDSLSWIYTDSTVDNNAETQASLVCPLGGRPGFQVLLDGVKENTPISFGSDGLRNVQDECLAEINGYLLHSVPVEYNTGVDGFTDRNHATAKGLARKAPFRVFDAMEPITDSARTWANEPAAVFVQVVVPDNVQPGDYFGNVKLTAGDQTVSILVTLHVAAFRLPQQYQLSLTTHYSLDIMARHHKLEPDSPAHWRMIETYARLMADYHHDMFVVPNLVEISTRPNGRLDFNFAKTERLIRTFIEAGFTKIEGGHIGGCKQWGDSEIYLNDPRCPGERKHRLSSPEAQDFLSEYLPAWRNFLQSRGWYEMLCQHVSDEPTEGALFDFFAGALAVRKYLPGVPILEPVEFPHLGTGVDLWVPKVDHYERDREIYENHRSHGDQIWCYTCCKPGGQYMNRFLDQPLLALRLIPWACAKYDITGYLHWALNIWRDFSPYKKTVFTQKQPQPDGTYNDLPAGDTHIVYPGPNGPWSSVRFEAQREGWEDHALLMQSREKIGRQPADAMLEKLVRSFSDFSRDPIEFRRHYRELLDVCLS